MDTKAYTMGTNDDAVLVKKIICEGHAIYHNIISLLKYSFITDKFNSYNTAIRSWQKQH